MSKDKDVDAVGACVGMKGMRVQSIIRELHGEKIDIIEYHEDAVTFAEKALQPAKVSKVTVVDSGASIWKLWWTTASCRWRSARKGRMSASPPSCWAGRSTSRARKKSGRKFEQQMSAMVTQTATPLETVPGLGDGLVEKLSAAARNYSGSLADMTPEQLEAIEGIGPKTVEKISLAVNNYFASLEPGAPVEGEVPMEGEAAAEASDAGAEDVPAEAAASAEVAPSERRYGRSRYACLGRTRRAG